MQRLPFTGVSSQSSATAAGPVRRPTSTARAVGVTVRFASGRMSAVLALNHSVGRPAQPPVDAGARGDGTMAQLPRMVLRRFRTPSESEVPLPLPCVGAFQAMQTVLPLPGWVV